MQRTFLWLKESLAPPELANDPENVEDLAWLEREKAKQLAETQDRLVRLQEQLAVVDRRKTERYYP